MSKTSQLSAISTVILIIILFIVFSVSVVYAAKDDKRLTEDAKNAIKSNDYAAFQTVVAGTRFEGKIDEEKFTKIVEKTAKKTAARVSIENNDYEAFQNAVVGTKYEGKIDEKRFLKLVEKKIKKDDIKNAIENNDYAAFQRSAVNIRYAEKITDEATFAKLVEAKNLVKSGDKEAAMVIFKELQIKPKHKKGIFKKKGFVLPREKQAAIKEAFNNLDYAAFTAAVAGTKLEGKYSEEKFQKKAEAIKNGKKNKRSYKNYQQKKRY